MASKLWKRMAKAYVALVRRESLTAAAERLEEISTVLRRIQTEKHLQALKHIKPVS